MRAFTNHVRSNLVAYIALFIALGGTSYAAIAIPRNSVGTAQLKNHSVTPAKLGNAIGGSVRAWAIVGAGGQLIASSEKASVTTQNGFPSNYSINWTSQFPANCATIGNIDGRSAPTETVTTPAGDSGPIVAGYVTGVSTGSSPHHDSTTGLSTVNQSGTPTPLEFDVAVSC